MHPARIPLTFVLLASLALAFALATAGPTLAEDEAPPEAQPQEREALDKHPLADAKPGEFLRYVEDQGGWKKYYIERIIEVRDGEVYWTVHQTNQDASKDLAALRAGWVEVPEFKAAEDAIVRTDEMVEVVVNEQRIWCRHLLISEPRVAGFPEPRRDREVWYSNDIPCGGKVQESTSGRMVLDWGMMTAAELKQRQDALHAAEAAREGGEEEVGEGDGE